MKPIQFTLDFRSEIPGYVQIVEQVQGLLAAGELKSGDQLPTVRQLASELRVNFNTIARAYRMLDEAGLISTQQRTRNLYFGSTRNRGRKSSKKERAGCANPPFYYHAAASGILN